LQTLSLLRNLWKTFAGFLEFLWGVDRFLEVCYTYAALDDYKYHHLIEVLIRVYKGIDRVYKGIDRVYKAVQRQIKQSIYTTSYQTNINTTIYFLIHF